VADAASTARSHAEPPQFQHHFVDMRLQREASSLGMWLFLVTEVLFFGGLFTAYTIYRAAFRTDFEGASNLLDIKLGTINTAILLMSSLTMALAVWASSLGRKKLIILFLVGTIVLGSIFLGIKVVEYAQKFHHHEVPGPHYVIPEGLSRPSELFFGLYFCMTGLHALHMIIGVGLLSWLIWKAYRDEFSTQYNTPVDLVGLYWHFVDIVWIFLFPLLYLLGRHKL
jgi:cytochrome c oxidase subunit 3